jgi:hypothetical protein
MGEARMCALPTTITGALRLPKLNNVVYGIYDAVSVGGLEPAVLTIDPGVVLFGSTLGSKLIVTQGSRLEAAGTASQPIVFTSRTNLEGGTSDGGGRWSGIFIMGKAPINNCIDPAATAGTDACFWNKLNLTVSGRFGGGQPEDNSGTLRYVQVRDAGAVDDLDPGGFAGLMLLGVGSQTTVDHVQVTNGRGGITLYGGRVSLKYIAITAYRSNGLYIAQGHRGSVQFAIVQRGAEVPTSDMGLASIFLGSNDRVPRDYTRISNLTLASTLGSGVSFRVSGGSDLALVNSVVVAKGESCLSVTPGASWRAADSALQDLGRPVFKSVALDCGSSAFAVTDSVPPADLSAEFALDPNNRANFTSSLASGVNGPNESALTATDPSVFNADPYGAAPSSAPNQLTTVSYVGVIKDSNDTSFKGWTCNPPSMLLDSTRLSCSASALNFR